MDKNHINEHESDVKAKSLAALAIAATISASGAAIDNTIDNPADILHQTGVEPVVMTIGADDTGNTDGTGNADGAGNADDAEKSGTARSTLSDRILALPLAVRLCVILPLWAVGHVVNMAIGALAVAASPLVNMLISFGVLFLIIGIAFIVAAKIMFPDLPLRKIINRHTIKGTFVATCIVFAGDLILTFAWPDYTTYKGLVMGGSLLAVLGLLAAKFARHEKKRRARESKQNAAAAPSDLIVHTMGETFTVRDPLA